MITVYRRLEGGQLPDQFVKSQIGEENIFVCFEGILFAFVFFLLVFNASKSVLITFFPWGCSSLQMLSAWLRDFCKQFVKEKMSNECDFVTEAVWKSAGFVKWDVCIYHILVLVCMDSSLLSYRFRQSSQPTPDLPIYSGFMLKPQKTLSSYIWE